MRPRALRLHGKIRGPRAIPNCFLTSLQQRLFRPGSRPDMPGTLCLQLAERHLTPCLFGQIVMGPYRASSLTWLRRERQEGHMNPRNSGLNQGAVLMLIGSLAFIGYAVVFLYRNFTGGGFELGVTTLNGVTRDQLNTLNPAIMHYIGHLHVAVAGFIAADGIAVAALSWYGVRRGEWWAWVAAVVSPVVGLAVALPYHYTGTFELNWVTHLGPIYVATLVFVVGVLLALRAMMQRT